MGGRSRLGGTSREEGNSDNRVVSTRKERVKKVNALRSEFSLLLLLLLFGGGRGEGEEE